VRGSSHYVAEPTAFLSFGRGFMGDSVVLQMQPSATLMLNFDLIFILLSSQDCKWLRRFGCGKTLFSHLLVRL